MNRRGARSVALGCTPKNISLNAATSIHVFSYCELADVTLWGHLRRTETDVFCHENVARTKPMKISTSNDKVDPCKTQDSNSIFKIYTCATCQTAPPTHGTGEDICVTSSNSRSTSAKSSSISWPRSSRNFSSTLSCFRSFSISMRRLPSNTCATMWKNQLSPFRAASTVAP